MQIEPKVQAATGGASAAALVCWALTHYLFHGALPGPVEGLVDVVVPGVTALLGGYFTPHRTPPVNGTTVHFSVNPDTVKQAAAQAVQIIRTGQLQLGSPTRSPARPAVAVQQPETPNPERITMSVLDQFRTLVEQLRGELVNKVGAEVVDDVHAAVDLFKGQAQQLLIAAGHDAQADAHQVVSNVASVATDAASAVAPTLSAPTEAAPAAPETPAAPSA